MMRFMNVGSKLACSSVSSATCLRCSFRRKFSSFGTSCAATRLMRQLKWCERIRETCPDPEQSLLSLNDDFPSPFPSLWRCFRQSKMSNYLYYQNKLFLFILLWVSLLLTLTMRLCFSAYFHQLQKSHVFGNSKHPHTKLVWISKVLPNGCLLYTSRCV